jgi:hypothetical protein
MEGGLGDRHNAGFINYFGKPLKVCNDIELIIWLRIRPGSRRFPP